MPVDDMTMRMVAALLRPKQSPTVNALADRYMNPPPRNWLSQPLPMEGRFNILPIRESQPGMGPSVFNKRELALPGMLAALVNAATAPGRAAFGASPFNVEEEAVNFAGSFMGGGLAGSRIRPAPRGSVGMNAYHGSPHRFDKFDMSKIGTGEGAQAYGHGLYFAENPAVASEYKWNLSQQRNDRVTFNGAPVSLATMRGRSLEDVGLLGKEAALQKIDDNIRFNEKYAPDVAAMYQSLRREIEAIDPQAVSVNQGNLYQVEIPDEAVAKMLDWDKPLSQQPEALAATRKALDDYHNLFGDDPNVRNAYKAAIIALQQGNVTGEGAYKMLVRVAGDPQTASNILAREYGIPGIRYLDAGSRAGGEWTRNIVLFDENLATIKKRE